MCAFRDIVPATLRQAGGSEGAVAVIEALGFVSLRTVHYAADDEHEFVTSVLDLSLIHI